MKKSATWAVVTLLLAVGARAADILRQFLIEAVVLCLMGCFMGIIVGRGATFLLPPETTLRVRLVAPLADRVAYLSRELKLTHADAEKHARKTDREREEFVRAYFDRHLADPLHYDLVLNVAQFAVAECAELIAAALQRRQAHAPAKPALAVSGV